MHRLRKSVPPDKPQHAKKGNKKRSISAKRRVVELDEPEVQRHVKNGHPPRPAPAKVRDLDEPYVEPRPRPRQPSSRKLRVAFGGEPATGNRQPQADKRPPLTIVHADDDEPAPPKPTALQVQGKNIPRKLRRLNQWVVWKFERRKGKWTKVPYDPRTARKASTNDPGTWASFKEALKAYQAAEGDYAGVGFVFSADDPYVGIDLDNCRDPETGELKTWATEIISSIPTYVEVSPSGKGVKLWAKGKLPTEQTGKRRPYHDGAVEMYHHGRYFATTGVILPSAPTEPADAQQAVLELWNKISTKKKPKSTASQRGGANAGASPRVEDAELLRRAGMAENGQRFLSLWNGQQDGYASQSEADLALCGMLAFWTGPDPARIDALFRQSKLLREKWDETHFSDGRTYGAATIEQALDGRTDFYHWDPVARRAAQIARGQQALDALLLTAAADPKKAIGGALANPDTVRCLALLARYDVAKWEAGLLGLRNVKGVKAKDVDALRRGVMDSAKKAAMRESSAPSDLEAEFFVQEHQIYWNSRTDGGVVPTAITNFTAEIVAEVVQDDGVETIRSFEIEADVRGSRCRHVIPAEEFARMEWVVQQLGARAVMKGGHTHRDRVRAAVQLLSKNIETKTLYGHSGWRRFGEDWVYLHGGGAIGTVGTVANTAVLLPGNLSRFHPPAPPSALDLPEVIRASLSIIKTVPVAISVPLLAATYRAAVRTTDFSIWVVGRTGVGKSEVAALSQQHFGASFDARHLPASWEGTGNSLEAMAFILKDALLTIDDLVLEGTPYDVQKKLRRCRPSAACPGQQPRPLPAARRHEPPPR